MRVLIVPSWYFPFQSDEIGGRMFHQLANGLQEAGVEAEIFFADLSLSSPWSTEIKVHVEDLVPTYRIRKWFPPKFNAFILRRWIRLYANFIIQYFEHFEKPDILHAQSYMAGLVCAEVSRQKNIPFIITERVSTFITGKVPDRHKQLIRNMLENANAIVCVSPGLKSHLQPYTDKPIVVIPNFYDPKVFNHQVAKEKFGKFTFISVGEPAYTKGLDILLKSFAAFKGKFRNENIQLLLIDKIRGKDELIRLSKSLRIEDHIRWEGLIPQKDVAEMLQKSHVLISSSRVETFGKSMMEALACGLPVIATKTDGAQFVLDTPRQGIFVEVENVMELANAMEEMFLNYVSYQPGNIAMSTAVRFQKAVVIEQWKKFYLNHLT